MGAQYSERPASSSGPFLVVDTGSPVISLAVGGSREVLALRVFPPEHSSVSLLRWISETLAEARLELRDLLGLVGLRGPGSFTGLRVGLATLLGLHQATGIAAGTLETFDVLAAKAESTSLPTLAVVDALRDQWSTCLYAAGEAPEPVEKPRLRSPAEVAALAPCRVIGFGSERLLAAAAGPGLRPEEPGPLAPVALTRCLREPWFPDPSGLATPAYLRPPLT